MNGTGSRGARRATLLPVVVAPLVLGALVAPASAGPTTDLRTGSVPSIPVVDAFVIDIPVDDGQGVARFEGAIHGAFRVEGGTVVYWSLREGTGSSVGLQTALEYDDIDLIGGVLADPRSLDVLLPLAEDGGCLCTVAADLPGSVDSTRFQAMYTTFPPLPAGSSTVDIDVDGRGTIVADVPVDGQLPPGPQVDSATTPLGTGWPAAPSPETIGGVTARAAQDLVGRSTSNEGSVMTEGTGSDRLVRFDADVLFDFGRADLNQPAREVLRTAVSALEEAGARTVEIVGHTDNVGTADFNQTLSEDRARTVADVLSAALGEDVDIRTEGRGLHDPIATNETEEGRAKNRRVTISYSSAPEAQSRDDATTTTEGAP